MWICNVPPPFLLGGGALDRGTAGEKNSGWLPTAMQIHAVKHLCRCIWKGKKEYETMFQLCVTFLPLPHGVILSCCSCIFSEICLSSVLSQLALHQTGLYPVTYVPSSFSRRKRESLMLSLSFFLRPTTQTPKCRTQQVRLQQCSAG